MPKESSPANPFETAKQQIDIVADILHLDGGIRQVLKSPKRELTVNFPVRMDDNSYRVFTGDRVQYSMARGPTRAASATTRRSPWTRFVRSRRG